MLSEQKPRDLLTFDEMRQIARSIKDRYIRLCCYLGMYGGFRLADILRIKKEHIDHDKKTIKFWMAKRRKWIEMPIRDELARMLFRFKGQEGLLIQIEKKRPGRLAYSSQIPKVYSRAIKKLKGPSHYRSGPHTFRHSFAHILEVNEIPWVAQQYFLGHKIHDMTGRYSHPEKRLKYFHKILQGVDFRRQETDETIENGQTKKFEENEKSS